MAWEKDDVKFKRLLDAFPNITFLQVLEGAHYRQPLNRLLPVQMNDPIRRYQQKVLREAVGKAYGPHRTQPVVEMAVVVG